MGIIEAANAPLPDKADVVIIGGGIVGAATAFFATRAGMDAVVLEIKDQPGTLATAASSECIREQWTQRHNVAMMRESMGMFERFAELIGVPGYDIGLHQQGYLFVTAEPARAAFFEKLVQAQHGYGLSHVELLDGPEIRRRFPWIAEEAIAGRFNQRDGWLAVHEVLWGFIKGSQARYFMETAATGFAQDVTGISAVITPRGAIRTRRAVIAAGPFAGRVAALAGVELPLRNVRREEVRLAQHDVCPHGAPMTVDDDNHAYWRPDGPAALLGGGEEHETEGDPLFHVATDWDFAAETLEKAARLSPFWLDVADRLKADAVYINAGQYSYVADRCPVIGPTPAPGLYLNAAYDGHGIMGAPAGSRLLVDLLTGKASPADNPFGLDRLHSGRPLEIEEAIL